jgi:hypothetical protein
MDSSSANTLRRCALLVPSALVALASPALAQATLDWSATQPNAAGDEVGQVVAAAPDGSVYVATQVLGGVFHHESNLDVRLTKFTNTGGLAWSLTWDTYTYDDAATAMLVAPNGDLYVATSDRRVTQFGAINHDLTLRKFTSDGTLQWLAKAPGFGGTGLAAKKLALLSNGAVVGVGAKNFSTLVVRFSAGGALEWQHSIGGGLGGNVLTDLEVLPGDEILACGRKGTEFNGALALFKYDASGAHLWTSMLDAAVAQESFGAALDLTPSGRAVVVGYRRLGAAPDMVLAQFDVSNGAVDWRLYHDTGGDPHDELRDVAVTQDGVIWGAGRRRDAVSGMDTVLLRVDPNGTPISSAVWAGGPAPDDQPQSIHEGAAGQVWVTVMSGSAPRDIALLQYDSRGDLSSQTFADFGANSDDIGFVSTLAPDGSIVVAGATNASGDYDLLAVRFDLADAPATYCTAKLNSLGCTPLSSFAGLSSASATSGFELLTSNVRNQKSGLLLYSLAGPGATPFQGGFLCVGAPQRRTPVGASGGSAGGDDCSGVFAFDLNAFAAGQLGGSPAPELLVAGTEVHTQQWSRDPGATGASGLSAGLRFVTGP